MFRDGQGNTEGLEVGWGSGATVTSVGAALSQEGAVHLYEIVTPARHTAGTQHQGSQTLGGSGDKRSRVLRQAVTTAA